MNKKIKVKDLSKSERLDVYLSLVLKLNRSQAQKVIKNNLVFVNEQEVKKNGFWLKNNDIIKIIDKQKTETKLKLTKKQNNLLTKIEIVFENDDFLIINKPSGILVHPTEANEKETVVNWLVKKYPHLIEIFEDKQRLGIVHRLDKETSGLLIIALNNKSFRIFKNKFKNRKIEKYYYALVYGLVPVEHGFINFLISRKKDGRMAARPKPKKITIKNIHNFDKAKTALTEFWLKKKFLNFSLLNVRLHTGRTHQIRVHFFAYNHPIVGDKLYFQNKNKVLLDRLFLHAYKLNFIYKRRKFNFEINLPKNLEEFLNTLKK